MGWFDRKRKARVESISTSLDAPKPNTASILEGDEGALTPVEVIKLGKLARLHPFSPVAVSVIQLFDREKVSTHEIANLLQSDPALAAETLAYVNSPLFALPDRVTDLQGAVLVLGAENTRRIAATLAMRGLLKSAPKLAVTRRVWRHSLATAVVAGELAPLYGVSSDIAITAGVLHDIGRIGLLAKDSEEYAQIVLKLYDNVEGILLVERAVCGMDHCAAGDYLCRAWALPAVFQEAAAKHHSAKGEPGIAGLMHTACAMADDLTFAAISHRNVLTIADRVAECVPESLRGQALALMAGVESRIATKTSQLDF